MHGRSRMCLAWLLAAIGCLAAAGAALGQEDSLAISPAAASYATAGQERTAQFASAGSLAAPDDSAELSRRLKELEAAMKKIKDKEEAEKTKKAGAPTVTPLGRIFFDTANFSQNPASIAQSGDAYNGLQFRNARVGLRGEAFHVVDYKIEVDFAAQTSFKDVYFQVKELPLLQYVRVGQYYEPFGLEAQTSTHLTTFMEKSLINEIGDVGGYKPGLMLFGSTESKRTFWQVGVSSAVRTDKPPVMPFDSQTGNSNDFNPGLGNFGLYDDAGGYAVSMRTAGLLWYDEATEGRGLLQTGFSYSYRDIPELVPVNAQSRRYRLRAKPESNLATYVVNTGWLDDTDHLNAVGPELLFMYGPFSLQSEYLWLWLDRTANADATFDGGYVMVSYFLTGENRAISRSEILRPGRVRPFENFFRVRTDDGSIFMGKGAWELAYRASYLNLSSGGVHGGRVVDHTFGLNWYLNAYTRVMLNYIHSETTDRGPGVAVLDAFMTRAQIDF